MTNKIIIDGIDVSKCGNSYYSCDSNGINTEKIKCHREYKDRVYYCDEFENCNYKQLKRKEQECENLKSKNFTFEELIKTQDELIAKLETKIAFYKKYEKERSETHKDTIHNLVLLKRYKQALDEIEKICQIKEENSQFMLPSVWQQILDIINKTDCRQSAKCFCEAKHADTFNADNQAAKESKQ